MRSLKAKPKSKALRAKQILLRAESQRVERETKLIKHFTDKACNNPRHSVNCFIHKQSGHKDTYNIGCKVGANLWGRFVTASIRVVTLRRI